MEGAPDPAGEGSDRVKLNILNTFLLQERVQMPEYYLDIETTGLDPKKDKIITIQYQRLGMLTGRSEGDLHILRSWDSSEKDILELFLPIFEGGGPFSFVAIGVNIPFMYSFIVERARIHGLDAPEPLYLFGRKPYLDIKPVLVLMNKGSFKGASLDRFMELSYKGEDIPRMYFEERYDRIIECIKEEADKFQKLYRHLKERAPSLVIAKGLVQTTLD
ncbi:MAG: hypothetical protein DRN57_05930 [Thermoplasmata archaeon]|nr:MAG: hypothetical protein DRN57_05930 [Thermoplasmata archaeon]